MVIALCDSVLPRDKFNFYQVSLNEKMNRYTASIKSEKPLLYYLEAPFFHCLPRFLFGQESRVYAARFQLPGKLGMITQMLFTLFYYLVIVLGTIGMIMLFASFRKNKLAIIFAIIPFYTIVIHAIVLRYTYNRFLMPAWSFLIVCGAYAIVCVIKKYKKMEIVIPVEL